MSVAQPNTVTSPTSVRVMVVDDSVVSRMTLRNAIARADGIDVAAIAASGMAALDKLAHVAVDVVVLDVEMPEMDGLQTLAEIRERAPELPVVMFSGHTTESASVTLEALFRGAADCVAKPSAIGTSEMGVDYVERMLVPRLRQLGTESRSLRGLGAPGTSTPTRLELKPVPSGGNRRPRRTSTVVGIGSSTGGPNALATVLESLPQPLPVPVLICQHMPETFTRLLASRLGARTGLDVAEARDGEVLLPGMVRLAPGGLHLRVEPGSRGDTLRLTDGPAVNGCRPAVDVLFESMAKVYGAEVTAVVLTGMGVDGADGAQKVREAGGQVVVQDEATSVVWGMPGAVAKRELADDVVPLEQISPWVQGTFTASTGLKTGGAR